MREVASSSLVTPIFARVAELVDAHGSEPCSFIGVRVQFPPLAPSSRGVVQLARMRASGARGRQFESAHPDHSRRDFLKYHVKPHTEGLFPCS